MSKQQPEEDEGDDEPLDVEREHRPPGRMTFPDHRLVAHHLHGAEDTSVAPADQRPAGAVAWRCEQRRNSRRRPGASARRSGPGGSATRSPVSASRSSIVTFAVRAAEDRRTTATSGTSSRRSRGSGCVVLIGGDGAQPRHLRAAVDGDAARPALPPGVRDDAGVDGALDHRPRRRGGRDGRLLGDAPRLGLPHRPT